MPCTLALDTEAPLVRAAFLVDFCITLSFALDFLGPWRPGFRVQYRAIPMACHHPVGMEKGWNTTQGLDDQLFTTSVLWYNVHKTIAGYSLAFTSRQEDWNFSRGSHMRSLTGGG